MNVMDVVPSAGDLGVTDARIVARGDRSSSVLWLRMTLLDGNRMPPVGSHVVDAEGAAIIGRWIDDLYCACRLMSEPAAVIRIVASAGAPAQDAAIGRQVVRSGE